MGRTVRLTVALAVLVAVLAASVAFAASKQDSGTSAQSSTTPARQAQGDDSARRDRFTADLAAKLGIDKDKVKAALEAVRQQLGPPPAPGSQPGDQGSQSPKDRFEAALAKELGIDQSKVSSALQQLHAEHPGGCPGPGGPPPGQGSQRS